MKTEIDRVSMSSDESTASNTTTIVTHCDTFHCDEVTACAMIKYLYMNESHHINFVRTRNQTEIDEYSDQGAYIVDVGGIYNTDLKRFDHHQKKCVDTYNDKWEIPLSSCGLIYKHIGHKIIAKRATELNLKFTEDEIYTIKDRFYSSFVASIDAGDNGVPYIKSEYDTNVVCNYRSLVTLPRVISEMNYKQVFKHSVQLERFKAAVNVAMAVFDTFITNAVRRADEYRTEYAEFKTIYEEQKDGEIMVIKKSFNTRKLLADIDPTQIVKLIVAPRGSSGWQIWTINKPGKQFEQIVQILPKDKVLTYLNNAGMTDDFVFVHEKRFIAGFKTKEAALVVAEASLKAWKDDDADVDNADNADVDNADNTDDANDSSSLSPRLRWLNTETVVSFTLGALLSYGLAHLVK